MRLFIALNIPEEVKDAVAEVQGRLQGVPADVKWVGKDKFHLTLKFLGEVPEDKAGAVAEAVARAAAGTGPLEIALAGLGTFPSPQRPRVVWLGIEGCVPQITALAARLDAELEALGFRKEDRPFVCHLTLGRVRSPRNIAALVKRIASLGEVRPGRFAANSVDIMKSTLRSQGSEYECLRSFALREERGGVTG